MLMTLAEFQKDTKKRSNTAPQRHTPELVWDRVLTPRVLIVEDDLDVHEGWSIYLRHHGYDVLSARDGTAGLKAIESENPDVVLLDLGLPSLHGLDLLASMKSRGMNVPVVVVTASSSVQTDFEAREAGASVVLSKPVNPHVLASVIEDLLG